MRHVASGLHIMEMIAKETKERLLGMEVEYRVDMQAVEKKPATKIPEEVKETLSWEQYYMEVLLVCEEEKEKLTREWRANCWKRLNPQMHAALKKGWLMSTTKINL